jgi:hypothetical protein
VASALELLIFPINLFKSFSFEQELLFHMQKNQSSNFCGNFTFGKNRLFSDIIHPQMKFFFNFLILFSTVFFKNQNGRQNIAETSIILNDIEQRCGYKPYKRDFSSSIFSKVFIRHPMIKQTKMQICAILNEMNP